MVRKKFKWNKFYLATCGILFFALSYFIVPIYRETPLLSSIQTTVKRYSINPLLDYIILPLTRRFNQLERYFTDSLDDQDSESLKVQIINLKRQLALKDYLIQNLNYLKNENQILRTLLGYRSNVNYMAIPAEIISYQPQNHFYSFWINAGNNQSISNQMPVIAFNANGQQGLVGFVSETLGGSSLIQTVLDPQTHVGITLEGYESKAILKGDLHLKRLLLMDYINNAFTNLEGRYVFTSGIGERYPQGIPIGTIHSVTNSLFNLFQSATVKPVIDFTSLKHVFVIVPSKDR